MPTPRTVHIPGTPTVGRRDWDYSGPDPTVVGTGAVLDDNSDASYAELYVFAHPDVSYRDWAVGTLQTVPSINAAADPAGVTMTAHVRYQAMLDGMPEPCVMVRYYQSGWGTRWSLAGGETGAPHSRPATPAPTVPTWREFPLTGSGVSAFLQALKTGSYAGGAPTMLLMPAFQHYTLSSTPHGRFMEAYLDITIPGSINGAPLTIRTRFMPS